MTSWRLIRDGSHSGPFNMGVDEALLRAAVSEGRPTLRFYGWQGPWLSLGYAQSPSPERLAACRRAGVGVVRRVTGGRAVLHGNDLTYAIAAPEAGLPAGLRASYARIGAALLSALRSLGLAAQGVEASAPRASAAAPFDCFEVPASGEIVVGGRKLAGNAQRRAAGAVLQHGSIRLAPDDPELARAAGQRAGAATSLREAGSEAGADALRAALEQAFAAQLDASFELCALDPLCSRSGHERERSADCESLDRQSIPLGRLKRPFSAADNA